MEKITIDELLNILINVQNRSVKNIEKRLDKVPKGDYDSFATVYGYYQKEIGAKNAYELVKKLQFLTK